MIRTISLILMGATLISCASRTIVVYRDRPRPDVISQTMPYRDYKDPFALNCEVCGKPATRAFHGGATVKIYDGQLFSLCAVYKCGFSYDPYCDEHELVRIDELRPSQPSRTKEMK